MIILFINFEQGFYYYMPETYNVSRVYNIAIVMYLKFIAHDTSH
jgi:hypothetical protein